MNIPLCSPFELWITGAGKWPLEDYLDGPLWLPFVEPAILRHYFDVSHFPVPVFRFEDKRDYLKLAEVWDKLGFLTLEREPVEPGFFTRVFSVLKDETRDRQIGDRRLPNSPELHLQGPSRHLPPGFLLLACEERKGEATLQPYRQTVFLPSDQGHSTTGCDKYDSFQILSRGPLGAGAF